MSTATLAPNATPPAVLDLEARLAARLASMTVVLDEAAVAFEVNTAHLPATEIDILAGPLTAAPVARPYETPIAAVLQRALARLTTAGWCTGQQKDEQGAVCLIGAIRAEAHGFSEENDACAFLLTVIQAEFADAATVPSWNDRQVGPAVPLRILGQAADQAAARGI